MKPVFAFSLGAALVAGCSLVNTFDEVKPVEDEATGGSGPASGGSGGVQEAGAGGNTGGSGGADASTGGSGGGTGGSGGGTGGSGGSTGGSGGGGPVDVFDPHRPGIGAIVAYDPTGDKLWVIDPVTGAERSAETNSPRLHAVVHDGIDDLWYIFSQPGAITNPVFVEARELDVESGVWRSLGTPVQVPRPSSQTGATALNDRLVYLSQPGLAATDPEFTVLDTSSPGAPTVVGPPGRTLPAGRKLGLIGDPNRSGVGGTATVVLLNTCVGTQCDVALLRESITATNVLEDTAGAVIVGAVNATGGEPAFAYDSQSRTDVVILPPPDPPSPDAGPNLCITDTGTWGNVTKFQTTTHAPTGLPVQFPSGSLRVSGGAFDSCTNIAFATSLLDFTAVWAIPLAAGGTPQKLCTGGGGSLFFEPYTRDLLRITIGSDIEAYALDSTNPLAPTLTLRSLNVPTGFSVLGGIMAVRTPNIPVCP